VTTRLLDARIPVQLKLSAAWGALMFLYLYADFFSLFRQGVIEDLIRGEVWVFDITQTYLVAVSVMMSIPALMVFFSAVLTPVWNRRLNLGVAAAFVLIALGALAGESYVYYFYFTALELGLLAAIVRMSWTWPQAAGAEKPQMMEVGR
jgi:hypothetical protein